METTTVFYVLGVVSVFLFYIWRISKWLWFEPKKIEKFLKDQGLKGTPYRFMYGDLKEMAQMLNEAKSKPMDLTHDIAFRVSPFFHRSLTTLGKTCFTWMGTIPVVHVSEPSLIREVLANYNRYQKQRGGNPLTKLLVRGLLDAEGDQWVKHRKIINPAFHMEKLKHMVPAFYVSCGEMIDKWVEILGQENSCEVDVWPYLQTFSSDVISRTAFGSSFEEGRKIFELQREQAKLTMKEVLDVFGDKKPDIDGLSHLKFINIIFNEVLRLYPPVIFLRRQIHEESKLGNLTLPAGTLVQINALILHHDKDMWGEHVNEFKPERFSEGVSKITKGQAAYLPFSGGPRICIGQNFAILEAKMALAMILQRFSFELSPSYSHAPHIIPTLQPQFGAHLYMHKL